jgi:hypothetical protein
MTASRSKLRRATIASTAAIFGILAMFIILLIPAATVCWPREYAMALGMCSYPELRTFTPIMAPWVTYNGENNNRQAFVFYRPHRLADAERIVGALRSAGYEADGIQSDLSEMTPPHSDATVLRYTSKEQSSAGNVLSLIRIAIPGRTSSISVSSGPSSLTRGDFMIVLF